jgi:hypothetical protein
MAPRRGEGLLGRLFVVALGLCGALVGQCVLLFPLAVHTTDSYPPPYHVAKQPGGLSLRLAMAHDTIHERYPRHGPAYFEARNRLAAPDIRQEEAEQEQGAPPTERYCALVDDLAVGQARLGRLDEAVALMRDKLERQRKAGRAGYVLYTSYANLGTFLIQQQTQGRADGAAKERLREGADLIRKAIEVNPEAHFGREQWELSAVEFLLAAHDDPNLLRRFDMVGNRLNREVEYDRDARLYDDLFYYDQRKEVKEFLEDEEAADRADPLTRQRLRVAIRKVGAEDGWHKAVPRAHRFPVPFDEPVLGILGMWHYGGGANPHFALALGETMLRVGQRYIAWCAYERAALLADRFSPDPEIVRGLVAHCRWRQAAIETSLTPREVGKLRPRFEAELAFGQRYQRAYQDYEAGRIRDGAALEGPHFYDAFEAEQGPIASPVGPEETIPVREQVRGFGLLALAVLLFWAGVFAFAAAFLVHIVRSLNGA